MRLRTLVQIVLGVVGAAAAVALRASGSSHRAVAALLLFGSGLFLLVTTVDVIRERRLRPSAPAAPAAEPLPASRSKASGRRTASVRQP